MSNPRQRIVPMIVGVVSAAAGGTAITLLTFASGHASLARGIATGVCIGIATMTVLALLSSRAGLAGRAASHGLDERERRIVTRALADTAPVAVLGAAASVIAGAWGVSAITTGGITIWAALLTFLVSATLRARRG